MEFTHAELERLLAPSMGRYDRIEHRDAGWQACDAATDEVVRASTRAGLIRKLALANDVVDLSSRPRFNGRPVLVAEVEAGDGVWTWRVIDAEDREYRSGRSYPDRERALAGLASSYDAVSR